MKKLLITLFTLCISCLSACGEESEPEKMKNQLLAEGFGHPIAENMGQETTNITTENK